MRTKLYLIFFLLLNVAGFAQDITVTGKVTDANGEALPGVNVIHKGTSNGIATDVEGKYSLSVPQGAVLIFSFVGFKTQEVAVAGQTEINVKLEEEGGLSEVVVTAYGVQQTINKVGVALQGKAAGVQITEAKAKEAKTWKRSSGDVNRVRLEIGDKETIPLHSRQIAVKVEDFRARVLMDCYFYNDKDRRFEGTFKLRLPNGASPSFFAFGETSKDFKNTPTEVASIDYGQSKQWNFDPDSVLANRRQQWSSVKQALVVPKQKAANAYTQTVYEQVDPALMEWSGADVFNCRVYPLMPKKMHHIVIAYDIDLLETGGNQVLQLALGNTPAKDSKKASSPLKVNLAIANTNSQTLNIVPKAQTNQRGKNVRIVWTNPKEKEIKITIPKKTQVLLKSAGGQTINYFAASFKANLPKVAKTKLKKNVVFLLDVSLSSQPDKFNVWLKTMHTMLRKNRDIIKNFSVLCFNVEAFWWKKTQVKNTARNVRRFIRFANKLSLEGATDLGVALDELNEAEWLKNKEKYLFLLSDGDVTWGENGLYQLSKKIAKTDELYAFSAGFSGTDPRILDHLARSTKGAVFSIVNESEVLDVSSNFRYQPWRIEQVTMPNTQDFLLAGRPQYLYAGQKVILAGRYSKLNAAQLRMKVSQPGRKKTFTINFRQQLTSELASRVYGQIATTQLEDLGSLSEKEAIQYAVHFGVPGQTCSYVMLESKRDYDRYNIDLDDNVEFIKENLVNKLLTKFLKNTSQLGNAKVDFLNMIKKLSKDDAGSELVLAHEVDSLIKSLPQTAFEVQVARLRCKRRTTRGMSTQLQGALQEDKLNHKIISQAAEQRSRYRKHDAIRLLSSLIEKNAGDANQLRDVGFLAMKWGLPEHTYFIFKKLIDLRPYQPPSYQLIAQALVQAQKYELAMLYYEIAIQTSWDDWDAEDFNLITAIDYIRFMRAMQKQPDFKHQAFIAKRLPSLERILEDEDYNGRKKDLMVYITWNTDQTYVDLYVNEPSGEVCSYHDDETKNGGKMTEDVEGLGPVLYYIEKAPKGKYEVKINYYNEEWERASTKTRVYVVVYRNWGKPNEKVIRKVITLDNKNTNTNEDEKKFRRIAKMRF